MTEFFSLYNIKTAGEFYILLQLVKESPKNDS